MKKAYIETYGCQMNEYDSELVTAILKEDNYEITSIEADADIILFNTCAIRENAHEKIYGRLGEVKHLKRKKQALVIGLLGCMAQNLRGQLNRNDNIIDIFAGPDSYKRLPAMIEAVYGNRKDKQYDFSLSEFEDYSDVYPKRVPGINAWIAVMRGCDNFCSFCVVPYTRGRERSRTIASVVGEAEMLASEGFRQITLLGQNVNSYRSETSDFADLMVAVAGVAGIERVRFTSPHPKDFPDKLLAVMADNAKICSHIHLPLQSGSDRILQSMNRTYSRREFLHLAAKIRDLIPDVCLTTDIIAGFSSESHADFIATCEVMDAVQFDAAYIFKYSERQNTIAYRRLPDDVPAEVKTERIVRLFELQKKHSMLRNNNALGKTYKVLVEGRSKKTAMEWMGRNDGNKVVVFPKNDCSPGDLIDVKVERCTANALLGHVVADGTACNHAETSPLLQVNHV
jgi:tRNA-2-methylthio-N6-dimethylallyladenosine synthase